MLPQPLPSGAQLSSAPPPPPPPRLSTAAFSAAAAAAARIPPARRVPTLHIAVVLGPATVPLLRHAHAVLLTLAAKGLHVFLQTEVQVPPPRNIAPITTDTVADVVAASTADFFVVIADPDLPNRSVQVRLSPTSDFVNLPVADLPDAVLDAWRRTVRSYHDPLVNAALAMNPNVVTEAHLDRLLVACADIPDLRRTYAALLRLVNITQDWEHPPTSPPHPNRHLMDDPRARAESETASEDRNDGQGPVFTPEAQRHGQTEDLSGHTGTMETCITPNGQEAPQQKTNQASGKNAAPAPRLDEPCDEAHRVLAEHALHEGIKAILRAHQHREGQHATEHQRSNSKSDLSFIWLRRSDAIPARILRSQLLARSLHERLVSAFDTIATMPVSAVSSPREVINTNHLPSDAHRERLLREVNDLIPRVEEIGSRLSKRPKTRRRRKKFLECNPWSIYLQQAQDAAVQGKGSGQGSAGHTGIAARLAVGESWRCYACLSFNRIHSTGCTACKSPCCAPEKQWFAGDVKVMNKRFRDILQTRQAIPTPWVFAPGVLPVPLPSNGYQSGMPFDSAGRDVRARSPHREEERPFRGQSMHTSPIALREGNGVQLRQSFDLSGRFGVALSFEDQKPPVRGDSVSVNQSNSDHPASRVPIPGQTKRVPTIRPSQVPPVRLATSAPNGPSLMDLDLSRMLAKGIRSHHPVEGRVNSSAIRVSHPERTSLDDHSIANRTNSSVQVGSKAFPSALYGMRSGKDSNSADFYSTPLHAEPHKAVTSVPTRQSQPNRQSMPKDGFPSSGLEELAKGSYEAVENAEIFPGIGLRASSKPIPVLNAKAKGEAPQNEFTSLEALAAASDAANGGTGSATRESLRAVSAVVTSSRGHASAKDEDSLNGTYNMF